LASHKTSLPPNHSPKMVKLQPHTPATPHQRRQSPLHPPSQDILYHVTPRSTPDPHRFLNFPIAAIRSKMIQNHLYFLVHFKLFIPRFALTPFFKSGQGALMTVKLLLSLPSSRPHPVTSNSSQPKVSSLTFTDSILPRKL